MFIKLTIRLRPFFILLMSLSASTYTLSEEAIGEDKKAASQIEALEKPLYSPFTERYILDELKQLRIDKANLRHELMQQILDREHQTIDRAVTYATDTVTYFFYLIAGATSILLIVGWSSIRDIKERVHALADEEISKLVQEYEKRLSIIENQLQQKTIHIEENREEIELTQEIQSLWLRSQQDVSPANRITIYDEILKLKNNDCEALTYKADAVLELDEPQWAINLCQQALKIDPQNSHAFYQLACAYTVTNKFDEALHHLVQAMKLSESYIEEIHRDPALHALITCDIYIKSDNPLIQRAIAFNETNTNNNSGGLNN